MTDIPFWEGVLRAWIGIVVWELLKWLLAKAGI
jgi:hypothetical protein